MNEYSLAKVQLLIYVKESVKSGKNTIVCAHNVKKALTFAPDFKITVSLKRHQSIIKKVKRK